DQATESLPVIGDNWRELATSLPPLAWRHHDPRLATSGDKHAKQRVLRRFRL
ncbi:hypothetical protein A2U01_0092008, partial [Trifolium medium]|nr:hypothetical protein [Trifolium medium]